MQAEPEVSHDDYELAGELGFSDTPDHEPLLCRDLVARSYADGYL
jgi:hypothetical protein